MSPAWKPRTGDEGADQCTGFKQLVLIEACERSVADSLHREVPLRPRVRRDAAPRSFLCVDHHHDDTIGGEVAHAERLVAGKRGPGSCVGSVRFAQGTWSAACDTPFV